MQPNQVFAEKSEFSMQIFPLPLQHVELGLHAAGGGEAAGTVAGYYPVAGDDQRKRIALHDLTYRPGCSRFPYGPGYFGIGHNLSVGYGVNQLHYLTAKARKGLKVKFCSPVLNYRPFIIGSELIYYRVRIIMLCNQPVRESG
jgi:hypothetical protein